ncbi:MAG: LysR family transcriptional regulator ArgP [Acidimicrobiales bacterium]
MMELDVPQLNALAAAVAEGTFDGAARKLHVTPSAISQRVKALETSVGRVLVTRTKPIVPTASGEVLLRVARQFQMLSTDVVRELGQESTQHPVVVPLAANADSLATWLVAALATIGAPLVFDVHRADQDVTVRLLREGAVMGAVTALKEPVAGCTAERLGRMRYHIVASPTFAARWFPDGVTTQELSKAPVVLFDREDRLQDNYLRRRTRRHLDPPRHYVPGTDAFNEAVRLGLGWGMVLDLQSVASVRRGELLDLDPSHCVDVELFWQQWRLHSESLERVADAVRRGAKMALH